MCLLNNLDLKYGLSIHEIGNISENCAASGGLFNPISNQNNGNLGDIQADSVGKAKIDIEVHKGTTLFGVNTVIGRTLVIHEDEESTLGSRLACGIIKDSTGFSSEAIQNSDLSVIVGEGII